MDIGLFDFSLPETLIAQTPLRDRGGSRLLVLDKDTGHVEHRLFSNFIEYLRAGDTLVLNDTKVIPARIYGVKADTGAKVEILLLNNLGDDRWEALVRPGKRIKAGSTLQFSSITGQEIVLTAAVESEEAMGRRILRFTYNGIFPEILDNIGHMPLPPYIKETLTDKGRYQTVYAREEGSAAAPTAGLHFTKEYLEEIALQGVRIAYVTLHVGLGTFRPVTAANIEHHEMHEEHYSLSSANAGILNESRAANGRIIAVGTTSARTLEAIARQFGQNPFESCEGWTSIFIYPGYEFRMVDALLTNFHLPKSTLIMLVSALAGRDNVLNAYMRALEQKYRFFSFGDAMLILGESHG